jgi:phosphoglycerate dehydrogenase-like enzyme
MRVIAHEPFPDAAFVAEHSIPLLSMEKVFREADFLTLHAPMSPQSRNLINAQTLSWMKRSAYLINTSRGGLVNEADLYVALKSGQIAGAGLDVFQHEPPPADHPLFTLPNVVLTAHTAGVDWKSRDDMALCAARAIVDLSQGKWPIEKIVNPEVREKYRW